MCHLPEDATLLQKLRHDAKNAYYQAVAAYICIVLTIMAVAYIFDLRME